MLFLQLLLNSNDAIDTGYEAVSEMTEKNSVLYTDNSK